MPESKVSARPNASPEPECLARYRLTANHTMCARDSPLLERGGGISEGEREFILITHNALRRKVEPRAANMQRMRWDAQLQALAQKRANLCDLGRVRSAARQEPGYGLVIGENLAGGYESWPQVFAVWMNESGHVSSDNIQAGHYTQVKRFLLHLITGDRRWVIAKKK